MKNLLVALLFALVVVPAGSTTTAWACGPHGHAHGGTTELSLMTLQVKKVKGSEKKAEALKNDLASLKGVKNVETDTQTGTVKIAYNKAELGCCSAIHSALKESKWKYELVSNEEKPACSHSKPAGGGCSHSKKQGA